MDPIVANALRELNTTTPFRASRRHTHATWARTFHSSPELYLQPQSSEEIALITTLARKCRRRLTTTGCGHSPSDMTCTSSWLVNLDHFNKILLEKSDLEKGQVVMQSGIRLFQIGTELDKLGLQMPNLGSINEQSIAGATATGTHGSTLRHGIISESILSLKIMLADSTEVECSPTVKVDLFRAALISLGALGIITEMRFQAVPSFSLRWQVEINKDTHILTKWEKNLWTQAEFVRVWWFPYTRRAVVWQADKTDEPHRPPPRAYYDDWLGYHVYYNLLAIGRFFPRLLPWVEWFVFGMQYGFSNGEATRVSAVQPSRHAMLMNCLYSQFVNEWAIPLSKGPEALRRLSSWLNHLKPSDPDYLEPKIPFPAKGLYVHAPLEVRVTDTSTHPDLPRPHLDPTCKDGPTLYLNATLYRSYGMDPPARQRYYEAFEYLMRDLGGKPHWAKNFFTTSPEFEDMYGQDIRDWREIRNSVDPEGMFVGDWHRRYVMGDTEVLALEEKEVSRKGLWKGGVMVKGVVGEGSGRVEMRKRHGLGTRGSSEESFDVVSDKETASFISA